MAHCLLMEKQTIENEVTAIEMIRKSDFRCVLFFYVPLAL